MYLLISVFFPDDRSIIFVRTLDANINILTEFSSTEMATSVIYECFKQLEAWVTAKVFSTHASAAD
jgi:hypothetical protein